MLIGHFCLATVFGILLSANSALALFSNYRTILWSIQIQFPITKLRQAPESFKMEGVDGTQRTIDNTADFVTARICVDLSLRLRLLTAS